MPTKKKAKRAAAKKSETSGYAQASPAPAAIITTTRMSKTLAPNPLYVEAQRLVRQFDNAWEAHCIAFRQYKDNPSNPNALVLCIALKAMREAAHEVEQFDPETFGLSLATSTATTT